jgi:hypothetical protein
MNGFPGWVTYDCRIAPRAGERMVSYLNMRIN